MNRKHVLDVADFTVDEINQVMATTDAMKEVLSRPIKKVPSLRGRTMVNLFYEASTRTRVSFEIAAKNLSADVVNITASASSIQKGESLIDTVRTLQALGADIVAIRHPSSGAPYLVAEHWNGSVINAGDGWHAHPTQALLDLYTIREHFESAQGLRVVIVGDILHSRVARSNIWTLTTMGAHVTLCGPATCLPLPGKGFEQVPNLTVSTDIDTAIRNADVVMALRMQFERQHSGLLPSIREYVQRYQINADRLAKAKAGAMVMHPGPMNEGIEISPEVAHGSRSVVESQVANGVAVRMALLYLLAGAKGQES